MAADGDMRSRRLAADAANLDKMRAVVGDDKARIAIPFFGGRQARAS